MTKPVSAIVELAGTRLAVCAEVRVEDCGAGADPVYHVESVHTRVGEPLLAEDYDEDDWCEMLNTLTELAYGAAGGGGGGGGGSTGSGPPLVG